MKYEESLIKLENIISQLESGEKSLDESLKLYAEGAKLSEFCYKTLSEAKQKLTLINHDDKE
ncbi:MAG: exodeoxyribonuclease VII small subunit [Clostridia bacterium]|nr:exodeoxyribonuclease VII small subunit [Clostridia bacterium]